MYTVDFGFRSLKTNHIVDNAITVITKPNQELDFYLSEYRKALSRALIDIQETLNRNHKLYVRDISHCVQKALEQANVVFYIVGFTCAHSIKKNILHAHTIPMCIDPDIPSRIYDTLLEPDMVFTLEPHVLICTSDSKQKGLQAIKIHAEKSSIVQTRNGYEHIEDQPKNARFKHISQYKSNMLSFFEEDTYKIIDNCIIKVT
jgi:methionine aminopeptidase